ncbi:unnamed protein product [Fraxinus pennsylvanica]|uniref:Nucleoside diphosphate kinase n=1 Tax=Fraxinus pennsylvanica TaxID=56036 RepID=A0AAD1Z0Q5_9LAMI|nr:unnamed protein product [Fraxinus pennsylvanica]
MDLQFIRLFSRFLFLFLLVSTLRLPHRLWANVSAEKEKTLAMIKSCCITQEMLLELNEETVRSFYAEHATKSFFRSLVQYMSSGPVLIMVLEKVNAIADWRILIGPTDANNAKVTHPNSIRAMCGLDLQRNCVHGSDSPQSADREITFFFNEASSGYVSRHDEL